MMEEIEDGEFLSLKRINTYLLMEISSLEASGLLLA
jgi:hypothetical protein